MSPIGAAEKLIGLSPARKYGMGLVAGVVFEECSQFSGLLPKKYTSGNITITHLSG
jgi:hypothetical protein